MKPKNFPTRRKLRQRGVKREDQPPHVADTRFRLGRLARLTDDNLWGNDPSGLSGPGRQRK